MRAFRLVLSLGAVAAALTAVLTACAVGTNQQCNGTTPTTLAVTCTSTTTAPSPRRVLVVGDSITAQSATRISDALTAAGFIATVSGHSGYSMGPTSVTNRPSLKPLLDGYVASDPDIVIIEAGTNDVSSVRSGGQTVAAWTAVMTTARDEFPRACVIATTVTTHRNDATFNAASSQLNAAINANFGRVVRWDETEWALRQAGTLILQPDLIHPLDPDGQIVLAGLDRDAALACP